MSTEREAPVGFTAVLRVRAFRILYGAEIQSTFGDQLARVALAALVFTQTHSDSTTALVYTLTYLPTVLGGVLLAHVGDRWPRRTVMVACELLRAAAFAVMSISGLNLPAVLTLLAVAMFVGPAFISSSVSFLAASLTNDQFRAASGLRMTTNQLAQVLGFGVGGALAAVLGVRETLLINAFTYLVSAAAVVIGLRRGADSGASQSSDHPAAAPGSVLALLRALYQDPTARTMLALSLLAGLFVVPESLAVPFAAEIGTGTAQAGLLLAAIPLGSAVGVFVLVRLVAPERRARVARQMAVVTGLPLVATAAVAGINHGALVLAAVCWFLSGLAAAYQVEVFVTLVRWVPDAARARLVSICGSLLLAAQGIGPLVFGTVASATTPSLAISVAGATGIVAAVLACLTGSERRAAPTGGSHRAIG